jgi:hypothetical protein
MSLLRNSSKANIWTNRKKKDAAEKSKRTGETRNMCSGVRSPCTRPIWCSDRRNDATVAQGTSWHSARKGWANNERSSVQTRRGRMKAKTTRLYHYKRSSNSSSCLDEENAIREQKMCSCFAQQLGKWLDNSVFCFCSAMKKWWITRRIKRTPWKKTRHGLRRYRRRRRRRRRSKRSRRKSHWGRTPEGLFVPTRVCLCFNFVCHTVSTHWVRSCLLLLSLLRSSTAAVLVTSIFEIVWARLFLLSLRFSLHGSSLFVLVWSLQSSYLSHFHLC